MHYVTTYDFTVAGRSVAELDVRLSIRGKADDWSIDAIELDEIGKPGRDRWFEIDRTHALWSAIEAWAHSGDKADDIERDYCTYLDDMEETSREDRYEEHRLRLRELL